MLPLHHVRMDIQLCCVREQTFWSSSSWLKACSRITLRGTYCQLKVAWVFPRPTGCLAGHGREPSMPLSKRPDSRAATEYEECPRISFVVVLVRMKVMVPDPARGVKGFFKKFF